MFLSTILFALIWGLQYVIHSSIAGSWTPEKYSIFIGVAAIIIHAIAVYIVRSEFIMRPPMEYLLDFSCDQTIACGVFDQDNNMMVINYPTWIRGKEYLIMCRSGYGKVKTAEIEIHIHYQNTTAKISGKINFEVNGEWDQKQLLLAVANPENKMPAYFDYERKCEFDIETVVAKAFLNINRESINSMSEILKEYMDGTISTPKLMNDVINKLITPEEIFGTKVKIDCSLNKLTFSAAK
ncbi:MAG TPA: hypothetical protein PKI61_01240 [bacterium]|nr:hypothetical protein [bacterium]HPT29704.1 hypothetical protein [bacterium]